MRIHSLLDTELKPSQVPAARVCVVPMDKPTEVSVYVCVSLISSAHMGSDCTSREQAGLAIKFAGLFILYLFATT